jgi:hypothetical protein
MPDWIIHMGAAHALSRPVARFDPRWLFLGAVLPDAIPRIAGGMFSLLPPLRPLATADAQLYFALLHTPFTVAALIAALVPFARAPRGAAAALACGAAWHFLLDLLQKTYGGGSSLLYPFDLRPFSLQVAWYENPVTFAAVPCFAVYLLWLLARRAPPPPPALRGWSRRRAALSAAALAVALGTPVLCLGRAQEIDLVGSRLAADPAAFEGREVGLPVVAVRDTDAEHVYIDVVNAVFRVPRAALPGVEKGAHLSLRGVLRGGEIEPAEFWVHSYAYKSLVSIAGLLLLAWSWRQGARGRARAAATAAPATSAPRRRAAR